MATLKERHSIIKQRGNTALGTTNFGIQKIAGRLIENGFLRKRDWPKRNRSGKPNARLTEKLEKALDEAEKELDYLEWSDVGSQDAHISIITDNSWTKREVENLLISANFPPMFIATFDFSNPKPLAIATRTPEQGIKATVESLYYYYPVRR